jgi:6-phosphogluconate dehydrogenase
MLRIKIIDVGTPSSHQSANGLEYQAIEVIFRDNEDQVLSKRLFSFRNKNVYRAASSWTKGTVIDIVDEADAKGFTQWVDFDLVQPLKGGEDDDVPF